MKNIYIDYDSVLNCFMEPLLEYMKPRYPDVMLDDFIEYKSPANIYGQDIYKWWQNAETYNLTYPLPGAIEFISNIYKKYNIFILTTTHPNISQHKTNHIYKYFGKYIRDVYHVKQHIDKSIVSVDGPMIDDYHKIINNHLEKNNILGILFNYKNKYPYAQNKYNISHDKFEYATEYHDIERILNDKNW